MMEFLLTPFSKPTNHFALWENAFNPAELDFLQKKAASANHIATVSGRNGEGVQSNDIRRSQTDWIKYNSEFDWIFRKLSDVVSSLNVEFFNFDLTGFGEPIQLANYDHTVQGTYGWHLDYGTPFGPSRKLSLVLQLSDPSEYEGGNLQLLVGSAPKTIKKQRGLIVAFPSYTLHQVTPVTQGSRQSLVVWISGPPYK